MQTEQFGFREVAEVIWQTLRGARMQLKLGTAATYLLLMPVLIIKSNGFELESAADVSSFVIALVTMCGALMLATTFTLFRAGEEAATGRRTPDDWNANPTAFYNMLLIIPTGAAIGGGLLLAAAGLVTANSIATGTNRWAVALVPIVFGFGAIYMVFTSSRFLFAYAKEQTSRAEKAQAEVAEARLAALQAQMNPHFLFNTLNTVAALVRTDAVRAEATVENLASVLRRTLDRSRHTVTTVGEEVDYVRDYLEIERERFGERLRVEWSIPDELRSGEIPTMTLQPLVENALKYGVGARIEGGRVDVRARRDGEDLILEVLDDGPGFRRGFTDGTGLGNLRRRLEVLFGESSGTVPGAVGPADPRYGIEVIPGQGAHVRVRIPFVRTRPGEREAGS